MAAVGGRAKRAHRFLLGFLGAPIPYVFLGTGWSQRDGCAHGQPNCSLKAELCLFLLYDLSFGEGFGSPSVAENLDDDAQGRRQRVALSSMT